MAEETDSAIESLFERALDVAARNLAAARAEDAEAAPFMAVAMLEVAANEALADTSPEDVIAMLRELADQIEQDVGEDDDD